MSFILIDLANDKHDLQINGWHWRTVLEILRIHNVLPEATIEKMGIQGIGTELQKSELSLVSNSLKKIVSQLAPNEWIFPNGMVSHNPNDPEFLRKLPDHASYRTNRDVVERICAFCDAAGGVLIS